MKSERLLITCGFILISLIWGSTWLVIKIGLGSMPPFYSVAMRFTLGMFILFFILWIRGERLPMDRRSVRLYASVGVLSYSFPFALVYWGEQYIPSGLASILFAINPFIVAVGSHLFLPGERMTPQKLIGIMLGFSGVMFIFWKDIHWGEASSLGMMAIFGSTLMQGISLVIVKKMHRDITPVALSAGGMVLGVFLLYMLAFSFEDVHTVILNAVGIGSIIYLAIFGTVIAFLVYYWLLKKVQAVYLSLVTLVTPVLAVILGALFLHESLSPYVFGGAAMILIGILIANGKELFASARLTK